MASGYPAVMGINRNIVALAAAPAVTPLIAYASSVLSGEETWQIKW
jgi:hypothetical protein